MVKVFQNRIPNEFFVTQGSGCSEYAIHPGSYHMALHDAGIAEYNIMNYSSVLPATSRLVTLDEVDMPPYGSELCTIMAVANGYYGEHVSAGIIFAWMYKDDTCEEKVGGLVCELAGYFDMEALEERLYTVLHDLHDRTFSQYYLGEPSVFRESLTIDKRYGTALVALCFVNFI